MVTKESIPFLSNEQLSHLGINTSEVIHAIETLLLNVEDGTAWSAPKAVMLPEDGRYMMAALAATDNPSLLAVKTLVLNPRNPEKGLPQINGLVTMLDSDSGLPVAILDGNWITAVRTAGLSATAAKHMARKDSAVAAFIGCGVQARSHLQAFSDLFPLREVRVFGRGTSNIKKFCEKADAMSLSSTVCRSAQEAVMSADIVVSSVTYSSQLVPFLDAAWLKPGSFAAITDLAAPWVKDSFAVLDRIIIDDLKQEESQPNKLLSSEYVTGDLSGLVTGKYGGRNQDDERNAFIFRGHAMGDLALSVLAYQRALAKP